MMNAIVVYSSQTGRIEQIAHAIAAGLPQGTPCVSVDDMPDDFHRMTASLPVFGSTRTRRTLKGRKR